MRTHARGSPQPCGGAVAPSRRRTRVDPRGFASCEPDALRRRELSGYALPPYQFRAKNCIENSDGTLRTPRSRELEILHGYAPDYTAAR